LPRPVEPARDTAQEQPFDVPIHYRHHPRAGEPVGVVRRLQFGGRTHFVIKSSDGTRGLLPAWMAEACAAQLATVHMPRLGLAALRTLRGLINSTWMTRTAARAYRRVGRESEITDLTDHTDRAGVRAAANLEREIRGSRSK